MKRKISVPIFALAFLISLSVFLIGIYVGQIIAANNKDAISKEVSDISDRISSIQILLSENNSKIFCNAYQSELKSIDSDIEIIGHKLSFLEDEKGIYDTELKKKYFILEYQSLVISKKANELCNLNATILINFYSNSNCSKCSLEGIEILKARDELPNIKIKLFSFDGELGSSIANTLKSQYSVETYPSIVINDKKYVGFLSKDQIKIIIGGNVTSN